jgi:hypothetical protein
MNYWNPILQVYFNLSEPSINYRVAIHENYNINTIPETHGNEHTSTNTKKVAFPT